MTNYFTEKILTDKRIMRTECLTQIRKHLERLHDVEKYSFEYYEIITVLDEIVNNKNSYIHQAMDEEN